MQKSSYVDCKMRQKEVIYFQSNQQEVALRKTNLLSIGKELVYHYFLQIKLAYRGGVATQVDEIELRECLPRSPIFFL